MESRLTLRPVLMVQIKLTTSQNSLQADLPFLRHFKNNIGRTFKLQTLNVTLTSIVVIVS